MFKNMSRWIHGLFKKSNLKPLPSTVDKSGSSDKHKPLKKRSSRRHRHGGGGHDWAAGVYM